MRVSSYTLMILTCLSLITVATHTHGALTLIGNSSLPNVGNLVVNGSFEQVENPALFPPGSPGPGFANQRLWATGTTQNFVPFKVPNGWTSSGVPNSYALWGNDDSPPSPAFVLRGSDVLPDGQCGMYFGNGSSAVNLSPNFNLNGTVTFAGAPVFTPAFGGTVVLTQTVNTQLSPSPSYELSFWVSGEGALPPGGTDEGIFGFRMTNVLAGDPVNYLTVPGGVGGPQGASRFYRYNFVPLNPLNPVTLEFINYGHIDLTPFGLGITTELVLDHVIIQVPEPSACTLVLTGIAVWYAAARRARRP